MIVIVCVFNCLRLFGFVCIDICLFVSLLVFSVVVCGFLVGFVNSVVLGFGSFYCDFVCLAFVVS